MVASIQTRGRQTQPIAVSLGELLVGMHGDRLATYVLGLHRRAWRQTVLAAGASSIAYAVLP